MKKLVTPSQGSARYFSGKLLTGGHHYVLVSEADSYASRQISLGVVEPLIAGDSIVKLPEAAQDEVLKEIVDDYIKTNPWKPSEKSFVEFMAEAYRFGAEAYTSELNGDSDEVKEEDVAAAKKAATKKAAEEKAAAKKAAEEKAAEEKAAN